MQRIAELISSGLRNSRAALPKPQTANNEKQTRATNISQHIPGAGYRAAFHLAYQEDNPLTVYVFGIDIDFVWNSSEHVDYQTVESKEQDD